MSGESATAGAAVQPDTSQVLPVFVRRWTFGVRRTLCPAGKHGLPAAGQLCLWSIAVSDLEEFLDRFAHHCEIGVQSGPDFEIQRGLID